MLYNIRLVEVIKLRAIGAYKQKIADFGYNHSCDRWISLQKHDIIFHKTTQDAGNEQITKQNPANSELCKPMVITITKSHVTQYSIVKK